MVVNCDCGKHHASKPAYHVGDKVRIRVHWRCRHMTGVVRSVRSGFNGDLIYDVDLDQPLTSGLRGLTAMLASELWAA